MEAGSLTRMTAMEDSFRLGLSFDDVLLVPRRNVARSRRDVDTTVRLTPHIRLRVPIISANTPWCTESGMAAAMARAGGIGIIHRMIAPETQAAQVARVKAEEVDPAAHPDATLDPEGRLRAGAAVGIKGDFLSRAEALVRAGADFLTVDVAHGHSDYVVDAVDRLRAAFPELELIAGNVATAEGARDLIEAGAQAIKVGIGPGSVCSTRVVTGAGVPQLTAVMDCAAVAREAGAFVIADGGIRTSGDMVKALAAGASAVMLGKLLAGADESSAREVEHGGGRYKVTTGFVTFGVELTLKRLSGETVTEDELRDYLPEGVEATFEHSGPVADTLRKLVQGLRSGITYSGGTNVDQLRERARFIRVTGAGQYEGRPHAGDGVPTLHPDYTQAAVGDAAAS